MGVTTTDSAPDKSSSQLATRATQQTHKYHNNDNSAKTTTGYQDTDKMKQPQQQQANDMRVSSLSASESCTNSSLLPVSNSQQQTSRLAGLNPSATHLQKDKTELYKNSFPSSPPPTPKKLRKPKNIRNSNTSSPASATTVKPPASLHIKSLIPTTPCFAFSTTAKSSVTLLNLVFYLICLCSLAASLYCNMRQNRVELSLRHLHHLDERISDMDMQLRVQLQQLQQVRDNIQQQAHKDYAHQRHYDKSDDEDDIHEDFGINSKQDDGNGFVDVGSGYPVAFGGLNSILSLNNAKDVTQAVRLLTRQVEELHRIRRDVSQLQISRRHHRRRQAGVAAPQERSPVLQDCGCQPGPPGPPGKQGKRGKKGDPGEKGQQGLMGEKGDPGIQGEKGSKGDDVFETVKGVKRSVTTLRGGSLGFAEIVAVKLNSKGEPGEPGPAGVKGDKGDRGDCGPATTVKCDELPTGISEGAPGPPGPPGPPGVPGDRGEVGPVGPAGPPGGKGPRGKHGKRKFTVDGTNDEYYDETSVAVLRGPPGPPGNDGKDGRDGNDGQKGETGQPGEPGSLGPRGLDGMPGEPGIEGPPGLPGYQGPTGDKGDRGDIGPPGLMGPPGLPGPPGYPGVKGDKGDQIESKFRKMRRRHDNGMSDAPRQPAVEYFYGPPGPPGPIGPPGHPGTHGVRGLDGQKGAPGDKGEKGDHGPMGLPGHVVRLP